MNQPTTTDTGLPLKPCGTCRFCGARTFGTHTLVCDKGLWPRGGRCEGYVEVGR